MNYSANQKHLRSGQALVMVLLSIGVVLTVALSVVARSVTDVSTSTKDEESLRAFSAAEAGVEQVLNQPVAALPVGQVQAPTQIGNSVTNYSATLNSFPENLRNYAYPVELLAGDSATIWLASHDSNNSLTCSGSNICFTGHNISLCWGKAGQTSTPAIALSILYEDPNAGSKLRYIYDAYDPNSSRASSNKFTSNGISTNTSSGACTIDGIAMAHRVNVNLDSLGIPANVINGKRLRSLTALFLYNTTPTAFGITNLTDDLPYQGRRVDSVGVSGTASRKVQVYSLYPEVPSMFQSALYSPPGIVK